MNDHAHIETARDLGQIDRAGDVGLGRRDVCGWLVVCRHEIGLVGDDDRALANVSSMFIILPPFDSRDWCRVNAGFIGD